MLSFRLYQNLTSRSGSINFLKSNAFLIKNQIFANSSRTTRLKVSGNISNIKRIGFFGITGTLATYVSCAIWEYENNKASTTRKTSFLTKLFIHIFRRPPKSQDIFWVIAGMNVLIFSMFRIRHRLTNFVTEFPLSPQSKGSSLFFSMFTHLDFFHIFLNMYVLHSFCPLINYFGAPHFTAIYVTGGLVSGFGSVLYKHIRNIRMPSVGASGAILTILGMFASMNPDLRFGIPFISDITNFSFTAQTAIFGLIGFDLCGLLFFKASRFDHVCHLSAVLYGVFYGMIGKTLLWDSRRTWMSWYYYIRS